MGKFFTSHFQFLSQKGFTLIELMVVFVVMSMLMVASVVSFSSYGRNQSFKTAVSDVENYLNVARSRALSRVKPSVCGSRPVEGYEFWYPATTGTYYRLSVRCGGISNILDRKSLPAGITFVTTVTSTTFFNASTGIVAAPSTIKMQGFGNNSTISVSKTGVISDQP